MALVLVHETSWSSSGGTELVIDHVVNGQRVSSRNAHMEYDSPQVQVCDTVSVGECIGRTGNTGRSFGEHLHSEILQNASDPVRGGSE